MGKDTKDIQEANRAGKQQIKQLSIQLESVEHQRDKALLMLPNLPHATRARRQERRGQRGSAAARPAAHVRFRAAGALGSGPGSRDSRLRACRADRGGALLGAERCGRAALTRPHQLHARSAYEGARLSGGRASVPRQCGVAHRDREPAEVRGGPVQDRRRLGSLSRPDRRGAADEPSPGRDSRRPRAADPLHGVHAVLPQRSRLVRPGRAGAHPAAPVRQSRARQADHAGAVL